MLTKFDLSRVDRKNLLGKGSFGEVYPYCKNEEDKRFVVKAIPSKEKIGLKEVNEIILGYNIQHPFMISILGYYVQEPTKDNSNWYFYLKMKRMEQSLKDSIRSNQFERLKKNQFIKCFYRLASSLVYLEGKQIVHRDLKPGNILLDEKGDMYISDFGLCTSMLETEHTEVFFNGGQGTYLYMAPEIRKNEGQNLKNEDLFRGDAWSLGTIMLDICLCKVKGLKDKTLKNRDLLQKKLDKIPQEYGSEIKSLISGLLALNPKDRMTFRGACQSLENNYREILSDTLNLCKEYQGQGDTILKKVAEENEELVRKLYRALLRLSGEFAHEFYFTENNGKLSIASKKRLNLSDKDLVRLSASLTENLEGEIPKKLNAIEVDFGLCSNITDGGLSSLKLLDSKDTLIQEFSIKLVNCNKISDTGILSMISENIQNLKSLKGLSLNMAGCESMTTKSVLDLLLNLEIFENLEILDLDFSRCRDIKIAKDVCSNLKQIFTSNLKNLKELTLNLSDTGSDCEETRSLIGESLSSLKRVVVY